MPFSTFIAIIYIFIGIIHAEQGLIFIFIFYDIS